MNRLLLPSLFTLIVTTQFLPLDAMNRNTEITNNTAESLPGIIRINVSSQQWSELQKDCVCIAKVGSSGSGKPSIKNKAKNGRVFIAKMDTFGLDRFFVFKTDNDINQLVQGVFNGGVWISNFITLTK